MVRTTMLLATALCAFGIDDTETIRQSYPVSERLEVKNVNGFIHVTASNTGNIQLVATKKIDADNASALARAKSEVRLDVQQTGGALRICVVYAYDNCVDDRVNIRRGDRDRDYDARVNI